MVERKQSRIPHFKTREEEAQFWDSHFLADFADELEVIDVKVEHPLAHILGVRLNATTIDQLAANGRKKGIGPSTLARIWIMERLSEEAKKEDANQALLK